MQKQSKKLLNNNKKVNTKVKASNALKVSETPTETTEVKTKKRKQGTLSLSAKNMKSLISNLIAGVDPLKIKNNEWWNQLSVTNQFKPGDVIFYGALNKFAIFIKPANKKDLIEIRLLKNNSKIEVYTRNWYINVNEAKLVKRGDTVKRGFIETDFGFELTKRQSNKKAQ